MWGRAQGCCRLRTAPPSFVHVGGLEEWGGRAPFLLHLGSFPDLACR